MSTTSLAVSITLCHTTHRPYRQDSQGVQDEESATGWGILFARIEAAGLNLKEINGLVSDGAHGLVSYLKQKLTWVHQQRCVWHVWRNLRGKIAEQVKAAKVGLEKEAA